MDVHNEGTFGNMLTATRQPFTEAVTCLQVLLLVPLFLLPVFLPRQAAHAQAHAQPRRTLEVWPTNHHRESAVVSTSNDHQHINDFGDDNVEATTATEMPLSEAFGSDQIHGGFVSDAPEQYTPAVEHVKQPVADSSTARVAGVSSCCLVLVSGKQLPLHLSHLPGTSASLALLLVH